MLKPSLSPSTFFNLSDHFLPELCWWTHAAPCTRPRWRCPLAGPSLCPAVCWSLPSGTWCSSSASGVASTPTAARRWLEQSPTPASGCSAHVYTCKQVDISSQLNVYALKQRHKIKINFLIIFIHCIITYLAPPPNPTQSPFSHLSLTNLKAQNYLSVVIQKYHTIIRLEFVKNSFGKLDKHLLQQLTEAKFQSWPLRPLGVPAALSGPVPRSPEQSVSWRIHQL